MSRRRSRNLLKLAAWLRAEGFDLLAAAATREALLEFAEDFGVGGPAARGHSSGRPGGGSEGGTEGGPTGPGDSSVRTPDDPGEGPFEA